MVTTPNSIAEYLLFQPITERNVTFRNRIVVSPMCQYSAEDGMATDWHFVHLGSRAVGGAGLVMVEFTAVEPRGRITPDDLGIWNDKHIAGLQRIAQFVEAQGAVPGIQLAHAGRKASTASPWKGDHFIHHEEDGGWQVIAPSPIPYDTTYGIPHALKIGEIKALVSDFRQAAIRARDAGFKLVEIHAAHGYLLHQFLSPYSNHRDDAYGGSFENRTRFLLEVIEAVKAVWPKEYPIWVRISATDWLEHLSTPSWTVEDSVKLSRLLKKAGVDTIDVSSGGNAAEQRIDPKPHLGYQVPFAARIRKESDISTTAVGLIIKPEQAESILQQGQADFVALAREFLRDPYWPLHAAFTLGAQKTWPNQYERAKPRKRYN